MTPEIVTDLMREALQIILLLVCVLILPSLVVGLVVSVFQAATQINEQTLSFIPRLLTIFITIMIAAPWLMRVLMDFTNHIIESIPNTIG